MWIEVPGWSTVGRVLLLAMFYWMCFSFFFKESKRMADGKTLKIGTRVEVIGKGIIGEVAYVGATQFSSGMC